MKEISCFMLSPTARARVSLRRYASGSSCGGRSSYHNASVVIEEVDFPLDAGNHGGVITGRGDKPDAERKKDPRWPKQCECGYVFKDEDAWQVKTDRLYRRSDDINTLHTLHDAPPGAMWYSDWMSRRGPDGHCLVVRTPAGDWQVDGPASNGGHWTRTGTPPKVTAKPSIAMGVRGHGYYHGFLTDGVLIACGDSEF